jgi:hypothetical protein
VPTTPRNLPCAPPQGSNRRILGSCVGSMLLDGPPCVPRVSPCVSHPPCVAVCVAPMLCALCACLRVCVRPVLSATRCTMASAAHWFTCYHAARKYFRISFGCHPDSTAPSMASRSLGCTAATNSAAPSRDSSFSTPRGEGGGSELDVASRRKCARTHLSGESVAIPRSMSACAFQPGHKGGGQVIGALCDERL